MFHGSPEKHTEFLFATTRKRRFQELAEHNRADIIITGHSHTPYHKSIAKTHFINPGSVGRMFDGTPRASFAILTLGKLGVQIELKRCDYDIEAVVTELANEGLPHIYAEMYRKGKKLN
jgi:predicted phosphodiesterase